MSNSAIPYPGLTTQAALELLEKVGPNELTEQSQKPFWRILWGQLTGVMILVLLGAAGISAALGDYKDAIVIMAIVFLNTTLGVMQEYRAEKAMAALKRFSTPNVRVRRDGHVQTLSSRLLVPGDIVLLETGSVVPADCRLLESANLSTQESVLTGESLPVAKDARSSSAPSTPIAERQNMVFQGTTIVQGRALAYVEATGMRTELGHIAESVQKVQPEETPLQKRLDQMGKRLVGVILIISSAVFLLGIGRGESVQLMFLTAVSISVAAIPESLPAVVAIALALGAQRMLKRHALVRKLSAVETLGSVTVICTDKTGTLTENRMTVAALDVAGHRLNLTEALKRGKPVLQEQASVHTDLKKEPALALLLAGGALCNDAVLSPTGKIQGEFEASGDPTETALVVAAAHYGLWKDDLDRACPRVYEIAFDSERKRMSTFHQLSASADAAVFPPAFGQLPASLRSGTPRHFQFTKGSVESLLEISESVWVNAAAEPLDPGWKTRIEKAVEQLGREGMRVLGVAFREVAPPGSSGSLEERNMTFIGLLGMHDPPRAEAKDALRVCREAGVRVHMVTGDHPTTAQAIAKELGMSHAHVLTGAEIHGMSVQELAGVIETVPIFARVAPEHKLKIVEALKLNGHVVAMTGDGVNDAPALKRADIGVAMGITGTDVSREAADMVLLDDNFATIVIAIQEGRTIYDNIKKFANYLLTTNAAEVGVMLLGPLLGMPIPLLPLQILWINLVTDGPPALSLGVEPSEAGVMRRTPRHPSESLVDRAMAWRIGWVGLLMVTLALAPAYGLWRQGGNHWQSFLFATLVFAQMAHVLAIHSGEESIFTRAPARNVALYMSLVGVGALQFFVLLSPFMQGLMKIVALSPAVIGTCLLLSSVVLIAIEVEKWHLRRRRGLIL